MQKEYVNDIFKIISKFLQKYNKNGETMQARF